MENQDKMIEGCIKFTLKVPVLKKKDTGGLMRYSSDSDEEESSNIPVNRRKIIFMKYFSVSPKYKFKLILSTKSTSRQGTWGRENDKRQLVYELIHCDGSDIKCDISGKIFFLGPKEVNQAYKTKELSHSSDNFVKFYGETNIKEAAEFYIFGLKISIKDMFRGIQNMANNSEKKEMYHIVSKNAKDEDVTISCPKEDVAKFGDTLVRQFENALNAEKPLRIEGFPSLVVEGFFEYIQNGAVQIAKVGPGIMKMAHMYHVTDLFHICDRHFAEVCDLKPETMERHIKFADTYESVFLAKAIFEWQNENPDLCPNWEKTLDMCPNVVKMVGKISMKLENRRLNRFKLHNWPEFPDTNIWLS